MNHSITKPNLTKKWSPDFSITSFLTDFESDIMDLIEETINELINTTTDIIMTIRGLFK